ncbi:hypothetical protein ABZ897_00735 [Nonomuraea sp. NPDC046802]|uniref:hypothetical protein n=1 Tax=Nonomuraea sp. NPDC046802 TaxID=3154919 RepID=UPI0033CE2526
MRIQILPLPSVMVGDDLEEPFALVMDQADEGVHKELLGEFARQCGAKTYVVVPQTVEIVDRYADPAPSPEPLGYVVARAVEGEGWTSGSRIEPDREATRRHMAELVQHEALPARYALCKVVPVEEPEQA